MTEATFIHPQADVQTDMIGEGTSIWQFVVIAQGTRIGRNCCINCHCLVEGEVTIGDNVTLKSGVFLWNGIEIRDDVFVGPNVTFTNDKYPRSKQFLEKPLVTILEKGCSIGAGSVILPGTVIGEYAMIGAGSLVTRDIPAYALVKGSPAVVCGWVDKVGNKLLSQPAGLWRDQSGGLFEVVNDKLIPR